MPKRLPINDYLKGIREGDRYILSRAITLVESRRKNDQELAQSLLHTLMPETGSALRIGITGVPGVGKSTFIEYFGALIAQMGKKVAVLAIDPSSPASQGSILGDKTRMNTLATHPNAFIRPSATGNSLGGVGQKTRETMLLCEAAGHDVILIETVGVGQSETVVRGMVDFFLLLMLPGAGDELQGIKRGIMEMADAIVINKADSNNEKRARRAMQAYQNALHLFPLPPSGWTPPVLTCSALLKNGLEEVWKTVEKFEQHTKTNGFWQQQRQAQNRDWFYEAIRQELEAGFFANQKVREQLRDYEEAVKLGDKLPRAAALELLSQV